MVMLISEVVQVLLEDVKPVLSKWMKMPWLMEDAFIVPKKEEEKREEVVNNE